MKAKTPIIIFLLPSWWISWHNITYIMDGTDMWRVGQPGQLRVKQTKTTALLPLHYLLKLHAEVYKQSSEFWLHSSWTCWHWTDPQLVSVLCLPPTQPPLELPLSTLLSANCQTINELLHGSPLLRVKFRDRVKWGVNQTVPDIFGKLPLTEFFGMVPLFTRLIT